MKVKLKELSKKTTSILIITILMLSMAIALPTVSAQPTVVPSASSGNVADKVTVAGVCTSPGGLMEVYWDSVKAWDGKAGFIAKDYAVSTGYEIEITIPETVAGIHAVIVKDVEASEIGEAPFTVIPVIELVPNRGLIGETVTVDGTGFGEELDVAILFYTDPLVATPVGVPDEIGIGTGTLKEFSGTLSHPIESGTVSVIAFTGAAQTLPELFTDQGDGTLTSDGATPGTGTINYVTGVISVTFFVAPFLAETVDVQYDYYPETSVDPNYLFVVQPSSLKSGEFGSLTTTFDIPDVGTATDFYVIAYDAEGNTAGAVAYTVGFYMILDPIKGSPDTEISVVGALTPLSEITLEIGDELLDYWYTLDTYPATIVTGATGYFTATFEVPLLLWGEYAVRATDSDEEIAIVPVFTIVMPAKITLVPSSGIIGKEVTVTGESFSAEAEVNIYFGTSLLDTDPLTITTSLLGEFQATFEVPEVATGEYIVNAIDDEDLSDTATFTVVEEVITIETRSNSYDPGDTISFTIESTVDIGTIVITVNYPNEQLFWISDTWTPTLVDDMYVVPYSAQVDAANQHLTLPSDATPGIWDWTAKYTIPPDTEVTGTFNVGEPGGPHPDISAEITNQRSLDSAGAPDTTFVSGQTVFASATVTNIGTQSQYMLIIVQWTDPQLRPLPSDISIVELEPGQSLTSAQGALLPPTGYATGQWKAKIFVLNNWLAQGGDTIGIPVYIYITVN